MNNENNNNGRQHSRRRKPNTIDTRREAFRKSRIPVPPLQQHQHQRRKPRPHKKDTPSSLSSFRNLQVLTGIGVCLANVSFFAYFGWLWYSKEMKFPTLLQDDFDYYHTADLPKNSPNKKVEKMWRYDRQQFHKWQNITIATTDTTDTGETDNNEPPPPILLVGLPKAGTSSIFEFFSCHGIYAQHWYCCGPQRSADLPGSGGPRFGPSYMSHCLLENLQEQARQQQQQQEEEMNRNTKQNSELEFDSKWNHSILDGCGDYDVFTEMNGPYLSPTKAQEQDNTNHDDPFHSSKGIFLPQHYHLEELHAAVPTAIWILNTRSVDDWIRSVQNVPARSLVERLQYEVLVKHARENEATGKYQSYNNLLTTMMNNDNDNDNKQKRKSSRLGFGSLRGEKKKFNAISSSNIPRWQQEEAFLRDFWDEHIQRVRAFARSHGHPLIIVNISNVNAGVNLGADLEWYAPSNSSGTALSPEDEDHHQQQEQQMKDIAQRVVKPKRATPSKAKACWKRYNAGEYHHDYN
ncbi:unnamed protein product [Cylindrotheca closterium]|uniref:Sulfotransferase domain-containing protein n=1 Tax=Cylindrotheca closterium TaxID=2856 RepID=A0AAD2CEV7_9STRA|nr:unnamed protein product [Cylindrotheca closterium]